MERIKFADDFWLQFNYEVIYYLTEFSTWESKLNGLNLQAPNDHEQCCIWLVYYDKTPWLFKQQGNTDWLPDLMVLWVD